MQELIKYLNKLNDQGFTFWIEQEKRLKYMLDKLHPEKDLALAWIKQNKEELLELLKFNTKSPEINLHPYIYKYNVNKQSLSFAQERLWFIEKYEQGTNAYNIPIICKLSNEIVLEPLKKSIEAIVERHEILRTVIREDNEGNHYQEVLDSSIDFLEVPIVKCSKQEELDEHLRKDVNHIYDLSNEHPIRIKIYSLESDNNSKDKKNKKNINLLSPTTTTANTTHVLSIVIHHIAFDGWSTDIFLDELKEYYRYYKAKETGSTYQINLPPLTIQYKDFALWQRSYLTGEVLDKQLSYWKGKLEGYETLHLATDYTRPIEMDYEGRSIHFELDNKLSHNLREVAKSLGVSLYSLMLSCYYLMLRAYTGQDDIVVGFPVANRHYSQIEHLIGFFVNTLALRVHIETGANTNTGIDDNTTTSVNASTNSIKTLKDFIQHVGSEVLEAQLHQDLPFEKLVEELGVPKDTSRHPIFQVMFNLQSFGGDTSNSKPERESIITPYTGSSDDSASIYNIAKFDLETFIDDNNSDGILRGGFNYRVSLYKEDAIKRFICTYKEILTQVAKALSNNTTKDSFKIEDLTYITKEEQDLLTTWNKTEATYPHNKTIHQLFEEQVKKTPDNLAVVYSDGEDEVKLTYKELNERANRLAHYLITNYNITPDTLVPLLLDRSEYIIISILAVLKAGGAYVPMDPDYPDERIRYILEDVEVANRKLADDKGNKHTPTVVITNEVYESKLEDTLRTYTVQKQGQEQEQQVLHQEKVRRDKETDTNTKISLLTVDSKLFEEKLEELSKLSSINIDTSTIVKDLTPTNTAYVIYTSGTTGNPKGVMQLHSNVMRLFTATDEWYHFSQSDVWTLFHSYVFDFTVWEIWGALLHGGRLVIPSYMVTRDLYAFYDLCKKERVTVLNQTPSAFYQLIDIGIHEAPKGPNNNNNLLRGLKYIIFGGEALNLSQLKPWFNLYGYDKPKLINMYGITETTVHVTYKEIEQQDLGKSSYIGKRIPDLTTYVLSPSSISLTSLPIGAIGELYVGGVGLARGYLNNEELTKEKFIHNPFQTTEEKADTAIYGPLGRNSRLYKTGDLVRWLPDGNLEYIGRKDFQVKIRGYRIELGEIESVLGSYPGIKQCVVLAKEHNVGDGDEVIGSNDDKSASATHISKYLVAYYTSNSEMKLDESLLLSYLDKTLPDYMIPSTFMHLEKLPLTVNGKLDRKALPDPEFGGDKDSYVAPRNEIEGKLCSIWEEVLGLPSGSVGIRDNFFRLGGNSILAIRLVSRVNKVFTRHITLQNMIKYNNVSQISNLFLETLDTVEYGEM